MAAWLHIWTPARDAVVPPVPWRKVVVGAVLLVAAIATLAVVVIPQVNEHRRADRERQQRAEARRHAAFLARVDREQRPRRERSVPDLGPGTPGGRRVAMRGSLVTSAEALIQRDAGRRTSRPIRGVDCEPSPRSARGTNPAADLSRSAAAYDCVAATSRFDAGGSRGVIGIPFRLVVHFDTGLLVWCRIVPLGDKDRLTHPLPDACRLKQPHGANRNGVNRNAFHFSRPAARPGSRASASIRRQRVGA